MFFGRPQLREEHIGGYVISNDLIGFGSEFIGGHYIKKRKRG